MGENGKKRGDLVEKRAVITACKLTMENGQYSLAPLNNGVVMLNHLISDAGGQGDVYHVTYRGRDYAMKWYCKQSEDVIGGAQFHTIAKICGEEKKPGEEFIWPLCIVSEMNPARGKRFGYLMELLPTGFYDMADFQKKDGDPKAARFNSFNSLFVAGMNIAAAMQKLHLKGWSYKDLNPKNFAINPTSGAVLVVDNDNVSVDGDPCSVRGMKGYMAPEIPRSKYRKNPTRETDYYSLAVVLYRLFYIDHPMEGKAWEKYPIHTDEVEDILYAIKPVFHFDPGDNSNYPTPAFAPNAPGRWKLLPHELQGLFITAFTEGIEQPGKRPPENAWISTIAKARDRLIRMGKGHEHFVDFSVPQSVPRGCLGLKIKGNTVALYPQKAVYQISVDGNVYQYNNIVLGIVYDSKTGGLMLRNLTGKILRCFSPVTRQITDIGKGQEYPIFPGVMIEFQHENPKIVGEIFGV